MPQHLGQALISKSSVSLPSISLPQGLLTKPKILTIPDSRASITREPSVITTDYIPATRPTLSPLSRNASYPSPHLPAPFSFTPTRLSPNPNPNIYTGEATKADLKTHIWSQPRASNITQAATGIKDGEVRVDTDVDRAISHHLEAGFGKGTS
jgi:hypothetical protein